MVSAWKAVIANRNFFVLSRYHAIKISTDYNQNTFNNPLFYQFMLKTCAMFEEEDIKREENNWSEVRKMSNTASVTCSGVKFLLYKNNHMYIALGQTI